MQVRIQHLDLIWIKRRRAPRSPGSGESPVAVSASVTGLSANTTYHFRVVAENPGGSSIGEDETFTTPPSTTYVTSFGPGSSEGKFGEPDAVAVDPSGNIWVAESGHGRVIEFNSQREYVRQFGGDGSGNGQFKWIGGLATNASGDVYVTDYGNGRVQEFSPTGEYMAQFPASGAWAIAVDSEGNVWVDRIASLGSGPITEFSSTGVRKNHFGSSGTSAGQLGMSFGMSFSGGNLYVAELTRVQEFSTSSEHFGRYEGEFDELGSGADKSFGAWAIATDPTTGNLYVSDAGNDRVQEFSSSGGLITTFGSPGSGAGQFSGLQGLAVNASGDIYVADTGNKRVQEWAPAP